MKRTSPADKLASKRAAWIARTAEALNISEEQALDLLRTPRKQSVRINTLLAGGGFEPPKQRTKYEWLPEGFMLDDMTNLRDHPDVLNGKLFIQNAASWLPVLALDPKAGDFILDICAAPGGKTSHIAAQTNNQARLWANDNSRPRLAKMQANLQRLGASIERFTLFDATQLARKLDGEQFDKILLDAPCSGEGLMQYDRDKDFATWSPAQIKRLQQLQKRILTQAWQLLKPGGTLVYSTCTMAPEEDEAVVDYLLRSRDDARIEPIDLQLPNRVPTVKSWNGKAFGSQTSNAMRLIPSEHIEAFFVAKLTKSLPAEQDML
jgi:tRNA (cytosine49-C5)-methyltransferase